MSSSKKIVESIIECMVIGTKSAARMSGSQEPGFNHALRLAANHMDANRDIWNTEANTLTSRYTVVPEVCLDGNSISLATNLALIDEHTTLATFGAKPKILRPGVSIQLQADMYQPSLVNTEVDIVSSVTRMGRNLAFVSAEVLGTDGSVHCRGSQIKYLPVGDMFADSIISSRSSWPFIKAYFDMMPNLPTSEENISLRSLVDSHLIISQPGVANFQVKRQHTNPFLGLHGGCHAMLMEVVGQDLADDLLGSSSLLSSIQVEYHTVGRGMIDIIAKVVSQSENEVYMQVILLRAADGKLISDGNLRWTTRAPTN